MVIQIERISARSVVRSTYQCAEPTCRATATWSLVERAVPDGNQANLGERTCCIEHIVAAYLSLRGAHLIARGSTFARGGDARPGIERRRRRKRRSIGVVERREFAREVG